MFAKTIAPSTLNIIAKMHSRVVFLVRIRATRRDINICAPAPVQLVHDCFCYGIEKRLRKFKPKSVIAFP